MIDPAILQFVTGPITLIAFAIWAVFSTKMVRAKQQTRVLEAAIKQGNADIVKVVSETLPEEERLSVSLTKLPSEGERMTMLTHFMNQRSAAQRNRFILSLILLILSLFSFIIVSYLEDTPLPNSSIENVQTTANTVSASWATSPGFGNTLTAVLNDAAGIQVEALELSGEAGQVNFSGLRAAQPYTLHLVARDILGRGETIEPIAFVTNADRTIIDRDGKWNVYYTGPMSDAIEATSDEGMLEFVDTWKENETWVFRGSIRDGQPGGIGTLYLVRGGNTFPVSSFEEYADTIVLGDRIYLPTDTYRSLFPQTFPLWSDINNENDGGAGGYVRGSYNGPFLLRLWSSPSTQAHANTFRLGPLIATPHGHGRIEWDLSDNTDPPQETCGFWEGTFDTGMLKGEAIMYDYRPIDENESLAKGEFDLNGAGNNQMTFLKNGEILRAHQATVFEYETYINNGAITSQTDGLSNDGRQRISRHSC